MLFDYPAKAKFGRKIPKSKIYEHALVSTKLKDKIVNEIDSITWKYKLAEESINLQKSPAVPEIQVFDIILKPGIEDLSQAVLETIDKAIPFLIVFQITKNNQIKVKAAFKRPSQAKPEEWVIEKYFESDWLDNQQPRQAMPQALDLETLHRKIIKSLMPKIAQLESDTDLANETSLDKQVEKLKQIEELEKEVAKLKSKRNKEPQYNRKIELNQALKQKQKKLNALIAGKGYQQNG